MEGSADEPNRGSVRPNVAELRPFARRVTISIYEPATRLFGVSLFAFLMLTLSGLFVFVLLVAGYLMAELTPPSIHLSVPALLVGYLLGEFRELIQKEVVYSFRVIRNGIPNRSFSNPNHSVGDLLLFTVMGSIFFATFVSTRRWAATVLNGHSFVEALLNPEIGILRVIVALLIEVAGNALLVTAIATLVTAITIPAVYLAGGDWDPELVLPWENVALRAAGIATAIAVVGTGIAAFAWFIEVRLYRPPSTVEIVLFSSLLVLAGLALRVIVEFLAIVALLGCAIAFRGVAEAVLVGARVAPRPTRALYRTGKRIVASIRWVASQRRRPARLTWALVDGVFLPTALTIVALVGFVVARVVATGLTPGYLGIGGLDALESPLLIDPVIAGLDVAGVAALVAGACSGSVSTIRLRERGFHSTVRSWRTVLVNKMRQGYRFGWYFTAPLVGQTEQVTGYGNWLRLGISLYGLGVAGLSAGPDPFSLYVDGYPIIEKTHPFGLTPSVAFQLLVLGFVVSITLAVLDQRARERPRYALVAAMTIPVVGPYCYLFYYRNVADPDESGLPLDDEPNQ